MKRNFIHLVLLGVFGNGLFLLSKANECSDACDATYQADKTTSVTFCGTDRATHSTYFEAIDTDYCYATCGLMAQYSGACGCANDCGSIVFQGKCDTSNQLCICEPGWGGNDCSLPKRGNSCSYHGQLIIGGSSGSKFPFDYCECDAGFTGTDCSSPIFTGSALPWGELYPDVPQYSASDIYGDDHPVFNLSHFATIRVVLNENDYISLLLPPNLYNESYAPATVYFDNNNVQETFANVGFRIKGAYSRLDQKKGWVIKFNEFVKGQNLFGLKKIGMKAGSVADDTLLKTKLYNDLYRTMNAPTQRSSFSLLYINERFAGVYYMHEDIGPDYTASRIMVDQDHYTSATAQDTGKGNLYKFFYNVNLGYYGDDLTYYETKSHVNELGVPMYYYEQADGNGDWSDFLDLLYYFNTSEIRRSKSNFPKDLSAKEKLSAFYDTIKSVMEVDNLLRGSVVESFMLGSDNMASGANYYLYHHDYDKTGMTFSDGMTTRWSLFDADFDECFAFDPITLEPTETTTDIISFYVRDPAVTSFSKVNPLMNGLLMDTASPFRVQYLQHYQKLLAHVFRIGPKQEKKAAEVTYPLPQERYASMMQFLVPWIRKDRLWQFSFNMTTEKFVNSAELSMRMLPLRAQNAYEQTLAYVQK